MTPRRRHKYTQNYPSERRDYPPSRGSGKEGVDRAKGAKPDETERPGRYHPVHGDPDDGGKISPAEAERISSEDFPGPENEEQPNKAA